MTDKDKIKFAIRYLKKGLKSKRTPPLYEVLMNELGFVREQELSKLEGKLADLTSEYYELENLKNNEIAELKVKYDICLRENTGLKIHSAYVEKKLAEAKELLREIIDTPVFTQMGGELYENEGYAELVEETEQFLKEIKEK